MMKHAQGIKHTKKPQPLRCWCCGTAIRMIENAERRLVASNMDGSRHECVNNGEAVKR